MSNRKASHPRPQSAAIRNRTSAILIAVAVHAVLLLLLAVIVILPAARETPEIVASVVAPPANQQQREKVEVQQNTRVRTPKAVSNPIRANALTEISIAQVEVNEQPVGLGEVQLSDAAFAGEMSQASGTFAKVGGMTIRAKKLGVIVDVSGSMRGHSNLLREFLTTKFKDAVFVAGGGAKFDKELQVRGGKDYSGSLGPTVKAHSIGSMGSGIELLLDIEEPPDAIYVFSDWMDMGKEIKAAGGEAPARITEVLDAAIIMGVRVYINAFRKNYPAGISPESLPKDDISRLAFIKMQELAKQSGGDFRFVQSAAELIDSGGGAKKRR